MRRADPDEAVTRDAFPVLVPCPTRWRDNDAYGHINNAVYYEYFDTAVNSWLHHRAGRIAHEGEAIGVVAESGCRYLRQAAYPEHLLVGVACDRLGRSSVTYRLAVFRTGGDAPDAPDDTAIAIGRFVHVYVDRRSRRPVPVPDPVRTAVAKDLDTTGRPVIIPPPTSGASA
ncbi:acyl-CoA thioesterase [Streptomyces melanosporofaciens]|uniref:Acyl-CoA thioester hydrolase n=1 Tax=Streptomyces melanosporofaciens TaxID=67327 RepID=A0A1H5C9P0_STRMJ|nr:thioesterase family protein [Streptomyces melanosporofaciens]SED63346.1 acyl-CoA thioester hydrolase [Streptomyces melanosporofaciens]